MTRPGRELDGLELAGKDARDRRVIDSCGAPEARDGLVALHHERLEAAAQGRRGGFCRFSRIRHSMFPQVRAAVIGRRPPVASGRLGGVKLTG